MPNYCYGCECGKKTEKMRPMADSNKRVRCECGKMMVRDYVAERSPRSVSDPWPLESVSYGVLPEQIKQAKEQAAKMGVPCEFTPQGDRIFESRSHRKKYCKAAGIVDYCGGYGDAI